MAGRVSGLASSIFTKLFKASTGNKSSVMSAWQYCHTNSKRLVINFQGCFFSSSCAQSKLLNSQPRSLIVGLCSNYGVSNTETQFFCQLEQRRFYQAALRPRLICPGCYFVWRHGRKHVECSDHPRHKQMKRVAKRKMWKEDYTTGKWLKALDFHKVHYRQAERNVDRIAISHNWVVGKLGAQL
ncbi:hypothetical protein RRG08_030684 [Elysia crispata]|uniref:39S ribosomal protein L36, mitochondrial n=1 Tax=Elysia crispata TaxID=231223 RepID=A0AAE0YHA6_9GAST|nr:hypothetical protein RRG08_030684 [Elysia crispata]